MFDKQQRESNAKLLFTLPNQCCYFTLQDEMLATNLLHRNVKTDQAQEESCGIKAHQT